MSVQRNWGLMFVSISQFFEDEKPREHASYTTSMTFWASLPWYPTATPATTENPALNS